MIYENQIQASEKILSNFTNEERYVMLIAQMQSGKTDTYLQVACEMLRLELVQSVQIICGCRDIALYDQLQKDVNEFVLNSYDEYLKTTYPESNYINYPSTIIAFKKIKINFGQHLSVCQSEKNTLFIWDESHYAQSKTNSPARFMKNIGMSVNGSTEYFEKMDSYFLSVSATPFSEYSDNLHLKQNKSTVYLHPGDDYRGVRYFYENKNLVFIDNMEEALNDALSKWRGKNKYNIIRVHNEKKFEFVKKIIIESGFNYNFGKFDQQNKFIGHIKDLKNAPTEPTIIIIKGYCRLGERVCHKHIGFVMETSSNSNADTLLQGLLGRMCGYNGENKNVEIYVSINKLEIEKYCAYCEIEDSEIIPSTGMNLENVSQKTHINSKYAYSIVPIITNTKIKEFIKTKNVEKIRQILKSTETININNSEQTEEIIHRLVSWDKKPIYNTLYNKSKMYKTYEKLNILYKLNNSLTTHTPVDLGIVKNQILVWTYNSTESFDKIPGGSVFIEMKINTPCSNISEINEKINELKNVPKTTGREVFHDGFELVDNDNNGLFAYGIPVDTFNDSELLYRVLCECIVKSKQPSELIVPPKRISKPEGILITKQIYHIFTMVYCKRIKETTGSTVKLIKFPGKQSSELEKKELVKLKMIYWD